MKGSSGALNSFYYKEKLSPKLVQSTLNRTKNVIKTSQSVS